jgi:hypothetical protein
MSRRVRVKGHTRKAPKRRTSSRPKAPKRRTSSRPKGRKGSRQGKLL